jgi:hypothetical protein
MFVGNLAQAGNAPPRGTGLPHESAGPHEKPSGGKLDSFPQTCGDNPGAAFCALGTVLLSDIGRSLPRRSMLGYK